ncbi:alpha/beta hydrolase [Amycolatopsis sulphurea]|uniref:hypothetical protein n=1 Tax=Amycolatopsis sulphurea TaxID=76022 RepID=UPI001145B205|nr:hypothetical protein [Amycolatopsis sulphurea]
MTGLWLAQPCPYPHRHIHLGPSRHEQAWRDRIEQVPTQGMAAIADGSIDRWFTPSRIEANPLLAKKMREMTAATPVEGYVACCRPGWTWVPNLAKVTAPTLVIAGAQDKSLPPEHGKLIAASVASARFEKLSPAAHLGQPRREGTLHSPRFREESLHSCSPPSSPQPAPFRVHRTDLRGYRPPDNHPTRDAVSAKIWACG